MPSAAPNNMFIALFALSLLGFFIIKPVPVSLLSVSGVISICFSFGVYLNIVRSERTYQSTVHKNEPSQRNWFIIKTDINYGD